MPAARRASRFEAMVRKSGLSSSMALNWISGGGMLIADTTCVEGCVGGHMFLATGGAFPGRTYLAHRNRSSKEVP